MRFKLLKLFLISLVVSCSTSKTSLLISDTYNKTDNKTTLNLVPYGTIEMPGEWTKTTYNEISRQHFFVDSDSTTIAVTKNPQNKYPFYSDKMTNAEFTREFFAWEKQHYEDKGFEIEEKTIDNNFIIWTVVGKNTNTTFLYGAKNKFAYNFAIFTDNWSKNKQFEFLHLLFHKN